MYNGLWFSPLKEAFDAFLAHTQQCVSGTVKLKFFKGSCTVVGRKSTYSLYDFGLATYDADDAFDHQAAKGFIDIHGLSCKVWAKNRLAAGGSRGDSGRRRRRHGLGTLNEHDNEGSGRS